METCSVSGCERLAKGGAGSHADLCGDHSAAEHALGRPEDVDDGTFVAPLPPSLIAAVRLLIEGLPDTEVTEARAMAYQALRVMLADEPG